MNEDAKREAPPAGGRPFDPVKWSSPKRLRLGKINGYVLEMLVLGGPMTTQEIAEELGYRERDFKRRNLPRLTGPGLVFVQGDRVEAHPEWERILERERLRDRA